MYDQGARFADLAGNWIAWNRVIGEVEVTESAIANRMIEIGMIRGARRSLLQLIRFRFPRALTPVVERAIADQPSLPVLEAWLDAAFTVGTAEDFLNALPR
jgi:hypothetical protein